MRERRFPCRCVGGIAVRVGGAEEVKRRVEGGEARSVFGRRESQLIVN